ncbi:Sapep family Mn(2+)-dependent dipeptidase [[Mycoplasma] anseris]|uniref:M20/M25/M40 family metallo-hydrolase n=1 Tax=[Mycoplasma] anseris TaxID=92400 RepID=A0A2Z4NCR7_9BACT|nr:Sapep family Mn(2+)-dependent dipeptidase [[Mycoplasma] anseris]AWX69364.1 M20/M25/M40 family metallo-hydrolase [[Mycoplasma] anseris]
MKKYIKYRQTNQEFLEMVKNMANICAIPSISEEDFENEFPFGKAVDEACNYALNLAKSFGFETYKDPQNRFGYVQIGRGGKQIGILAHLDVVPAGDESQWISNAFSPIITETELFGRGSLDDKGPAIINLYAMKYIKDNHLLSDEWSIRLIFGLSEETTMKSMKCYLKEFEAPYISYTPDGEWPLIYAEKMVYHVNLKFPKIKNIEFNGGDVINQIPDTLYIKNIDAAILKNLNQPDFQILESNQIVVKGKSGHGSTPDKGDNAILKALKAIINNPDYQEYELIKFIKQSFNGNFELANIFKNYEDTSGKLSANLGMIRTTNDKYILSFDLRVPVSHSKEEVSKDWETYLNQFNNQVQYELIGHKPAKYIAKNNKLVKILMDTYNESYNAKEEPLAIGGGTYARLLDTCVAFGSTKEMHLMHGANEAFSFKEMKESLEIYINALNRLQEYDE